MRTKSQKTFLLLQGHPSRFWRRLGLALDRAGHRVLKVNFCVADWVFWRGRGGGSISEVNYKGQIADWPAWLAEFVANNGVTDILYYADRLPYHIDALAVGRAHGIDCWAIEFGYLRPDWLTLEPEGMGAHSVFPRDWADIGALAAGEEAPDMAVHYRHAFAVEAFGEVAFNLLMAFGRPFYRHYFSDKIYWPLVDYLSWLRELARKPGQNRQARKLEHILFRDRRSYNLVAMQLQADYQIRASSHYIGLMEFLREVIISFAENAPYERHLVIKLHPLDNGMEKWEKRCRRLIHRAGLAGKIHFIKGGDLDRLIAASDGVVTVNSTVGIHAIRADMPTLALGRAIYDLPGLTHQDGIDSFWRSPARVDADLRDTFLRALATFQVKGSFFNRAGQNRAIDTMVARLSQPVAVPQDATGPHTTRDDPGILAQSA